jgi:ABC-type dipeptide/oligopeptide/nickel transport system permease component
MQDEVEDASFWCKVCLALIIGVIWGLLPMQGVSGLFFAVAAAAALQSGFLQVWLQIDPEDFGGALNLLKEGAMPTLSLFLVRY